MSPRLAWLLPVLPALAAVALMLSGRRQPARGAWLACGATGGSLVLSCLVLIRALPHPGRVVETSQVIATAGPVTVTAGTRVGGLAALVAVMVCVVAFLVQVYSVGYMRGDPRYASYAGYVSLFTAAMLVVVLAADLLELLVGWEVMGFCSYALIGHHWEERTASDAAIKAFLTTRFGDLFFTVGLFVLGIGAGTFRVSGVLSAVGEGRLSHAELTAAGLLLLGGVAGKSAQFPLQTWLPDAMAGPTPISALIHAATMVAAGVYVVALLYPVVVASAVTVSVLALVAAVTMLLGALAACAHDDIKKVLAWSTVSQLGYMTGGLAVGGWAAGLFHLLTHAAFKALLFLGAGAVIHAVGTNSMKEMGGLRRALPVTFACTTVGLGALAGVPPFAGFFSKDAVLAAAYEAATGGSPVPVERPVAWVVYGAGLATVLVTAAYATRLWLRVFFGAPRATAEPHESPWVMRGPLVVLATAATVLGAVGITHTGGLARWLGPVPLPGEEGAERTGELGLSALTASVTITLVAVGLFAVLAIWRGAPALDPARRLGRVAPVMAGGFGFDLLYAWAFVRPVRDRLAPEVAALDSRVVDGVVEGAGDATTLVGRALQRLQNGNVQAYATGVVFGAVVLAAAVAMGAAS